MQKNRIIVGFSIIILFFIVFCGCTSNSNRLDSIPNDAVKMSPETDLYPPVIHSEQYYNPIPMEGPINTAGAEDAPVISLDGTTFLFFFTPDVKVPAEQQVLDGVTGIWWSKKEADTWSEPERVILKYGISLDGPLCICGNTLWFCSVRQGNYREIDIYTAELLNNNWKNWENCGQILNEVYQIGELYTSSDGNTMIFHRPGEDGYGGYDLYLTEKIYGEWTKPTNLGPLINTESDEGWPYLSPDGKELWYTSWSKLGYYGPALFRTIKDQEGNWSEPKEMISNFAGDPGLDSQGNVYFTHHYYSESLEMIEADIYVAYHK